MDSEGDLNIWLRKNSNFAQNGQSHHLRCKESTQTLPLSLISLASLSFPCCFSHTLFSLSPLTRHKHLLKHGCGQSNEIDRKRADRVDGEAEEFEKDLREVFRYVSNPSAMLTCEVMVEEM